MTVTVSKPQLNLREELSALKKKSGIKGEELLRANTADDVYSLLNTTMFRNRVINGDMRIDQRNVGAAVSRLGNDSTVAFAVDRTFVFNNTGTANTTVTGQQVAVTDTSVPFDYALRATIGNTSGRTTYDARFQQNIEGNNVADFRLNGTATHPIAVSFWARASKAGRTVYALWASNAGTGAYFYEWVDLTTSWKKYTIIIPPCTVSGAEILRNNGRGFGTGLYWALGYFGNNQSQKIGRWFSGSELNSYLAGMDNFASSGDWIEFTGYQIEKGAVATPFEFRQHSTELALCQRYFWRVYGQNIDIAMNNQTAPYSSVTFCTLNNPVTMRASGTFAHNMTNAKNTTSAPGADQWAWYIQNQGYGSTSSGDIANLNGGGQLYCRIGAYTLSPSAASTGIRMGANIYIENSAEL